MSQVDQSLCAGLIHELDSMWPGHVITGARQAGYDSADHVNGSVVTEVDVAGDEKRSNMAATGSDLEPTNQPSPICPPPPPPPLPAPILTPAPSTNPAAYRAKTLPVKVFGVRRVWCR